MAVILVEQTAGGFKISFRSRCAIGLQRVAEQFGGGGTRRRPGPFWTSRLTSARQKVLDAVLRSDDDKRQGVGGRSGYPLPGILAVSKLQNP